MVENITVYILKGCSGSGKTTLAKELIKGKIGIICSADDYFYNDGIYNFDETRLHQAHLACEKKYKDALESGLFEVIVVANVNARLRDWKFYHEEAKNFNVEYIFHLVVETHHENSNLHGVGEELLQKQAHRIKSNLKLL